MKILMRPQRSELGIGRVVDAYRRYLPAYGVTFVEDEAQADLVVTHAGVRTSVQPDVLHCHGLYPTATVDDSEPYYDMNVDVIENLRVARLVTVPSEWVAGILRRDMLIDPVVVPHGVDVSEWDYVSVKQSYVLWAKGHTPGVCDYRAVNELAKRMPDVRFMTTFGGGAPNVDVVGRLPFGAMKKTIEQAGVYLATTKETFGIQTLEAMASGVPVVGYNWGGTSGIVRHGETGWLAEPSDIDDLVAGIRWALDNRDVLAANSRNLVEEAFSWYGVCNILAYHYNTLITPSPVEEMAASIIIPCYNYAAKVGRAVRSALLQDFEGSYDVTVVNDGSTDNSWDVLQQFKDQVTLIDSPNQGVAGARNLGIRMSAGRYVACLDADDEMAPDFLSKLVPPMEQDRGLGITYGRLRLPVEGGEVVVGGWPNNFSFEHQSMGHNQVPSACVFRRKAWERAGGYRSKYTPAEDAELWYRITMLGYRAEMVTQDVVYYYDAHLNSLSRTMREPAYADDKPWSHNRSLMPLAADASEYAMSTYPVRNYDEPWVSVVVPVGPKHTDAVVRAIDSVWLQSLPLWELIVINDSGGELMHSPTGRSLQEAYPFIELFDVDYRNVSMSRNTGADLAKARLIVFLDADDWLDQNYLSDVVTAYNDNPGHYIYTDWLSYNGTKAKHGARDFSCENLKLEALHPITTLIPLAWHQEIGGFDEGLGVIGWEDWDYYLKMVVVEGHCGFRLDKPLMMYDVSSGARRDSSLDRKEELIPIIKERYGDIMCKHCPPRSVPLAALAQPVMPAPVRAVAAQAQAGLRARPQPARARSNRVVRMANNPPARGRGVPLPPTSRPVIPTGRKVEMAASRASGVMITVRENSGNVGSHSVIGRVSRIKYGRHKHNDVFEMDEADQRAQPQLYLQVVSAPAPARMPQRPQVTRPQVARPQVTRPHVSRPIRRPPRERMMDEPESYMPPHAVAQPTAAPTRKAVEAPAALPPQVDVEPLEDYDVVKDGIDLSILPLTAIRNLKLTADEAADAYIEEDEGRGRKTVLRYLRTLAGDLLEFE